MQNSVQSASSPLPTPACGYSAQRRSEDLAYQAVTVAAILLVLGSLWLF